MSGRHALVTGGAGFIGSHLVARLLAEGRQVTVLDNLSVGRADAVPSGTRFVHGDVRDASIVRTALADVDHVFHLAAQVTIRGSFTRFYDDLDTNVMGTAQLLQQIDPARVRWFTLASSMAVYADAPDGSPIDEGHPTSPLSPYGVGKLAGECVARQVLESRGVPLTTLRYFNTYGPGQTYTPYVGVITIFVTQLLRGQAPTIFGDGTQQRDFVHVDDIVAGTAAAPGRPPGTYNLGSGKATSLTRLAALIARSIPSGPPFQSAPEPPGELRYSVADIQAARAGLGYVPRHVLEDDIDALVADIRKKTLETDRAAAR